ncbi:hypothetical protein HHJ73_08185 [Mobiluncus mulieris]|uniref:hypothetical protein n=1 Tax=Mobiluncus mulieris TaxID=2052 RepID=UPI00146FF9DB|nr:hypothetical protein [Mobiluncus mulieris]NMW81730.1 hypothetical protein [Mobiluncus mulieris]
MLFKDMDWAQRKNIKERKSYFTILEEVKQEALKLPNIISLDETTRNHFAYRFSSIADVVTHLRSNFMTLCFDETRCFKILSTNLPDSCNPNRTSLCYLLTHYNENLEQIFKPALYKIKHLIFLGSKV